MNLSASAPRAFGLSRSTATWCAAVMLLALCACSGSPAPSKPTQTAARVNRSEITVHQINLLLRQSDVAAAEAQAAGRQMLERLIDQELAVQQALDLKLDRDPQVVLQLEAARREVLARAFAESIVGDVTGPSAEDVDRFYRSRPALFAQRKVYTLDELRIAPASEAQLAELKAQLKSSSTLADVARHAQKAGLRAASGQVQRAADQLPLSHLDVVAALNPGQMALVPSAEGLHAVALVEARPDPWSIEQARPFIEQYLFNDRRRTRLEENLRTLRAQAEIEYKGQFALSPGVPR